MKKSNTSVGSVARWDALADGKLYYFIEVLFYLLDLNNFGLKARLSQNSTLSLCKLNVIL